ncbi:MAG: hypothetical protein M5R40_13105 [Anaerolineae bacterium]|nr:hypothetical protein [Anaerolineae bacterium]
MGLFEPFAAAGLPLTYDSRWDDAESACCAVRYSDPAGLGLAWADVATFDVALAEAVPRPSVAVRHRLSDDLLLVGYDAPAYAVAGQPVAATLYLRALGDVSGRALYAGCEDLPSEMQALPSLPAGASLVLPVTLSAPAEATSVCVSNVSLDFRFVLPPIPERGSPARRARQLRREGAAAGGALRRGVAAAGRPARRVPGVAAGGGLRQRLHGDGAAHRAGRRAARAGGRLPGAGHVPDQPVAGRRAHPGRLPGAPGGRRAAGDVPGAGGDVSPRHAGAPAGG